MGFRLLPKLVTLNYVLVSVSLFRIRLAQCLAHCCLVPKTLRPSADRSEQFGTGAEVSYEHVGRVPNCPGSEVSVHHVLQR